MAQRHLVIGGHSQIARAMRRLYPGSFDYVIRGFPPNSNIANERHSDIVIGTYDGMSATHMEGYDSVISLVGSAAGSSDELMAINASLPARFAREAAIAGVAHFIAISSFSVYGPAARIESGTPLRPHTVYGRSRLAGEEKISELADRMHCTIARCPLLYGYGNSKLEKLVSTWCRIGVIPAPASAVSRSMAHYDLAAEYINDTVHARPAGVGLKIDHFADPVAFEYRRVAAILSSVTGKRKRVASLPQLGIRLFAAISPELSRSLFCDSLLAPASNHFHDLSHTRLDQDIARMARTQEGAL